jgi:hypothetical protein
MQRRMRPELIPSAAAQGHTNPIPAVCRIQFPFEGGMSCYCLDATTIRKMS